MEEQVKSNKTQIKPTGAAMRFLTLKKMNRKETLETMLKIQDGINQFKLLIEIQLDNVGKHGKAFSFLRKKYLHDIDIYNRCIIRLEERFTKQLNTLK